MRLSVKEDWTEVVSTTLYAEKLRLLTLDMGPEDDLGVWPIFFKIGMRAATRCVSSTLEHHWTKELDIH